MGPAMTEAQTAIGSLLIGAVLSGVVSWYFFRKSINKKLVAYLHSESPVLAAVDDPKIRKELEIHFRGQKIVDLLRLQFVIANEGDRAIRDVMQPLTLELPAPARLLDASIQHVHPRGRDVTVRITGAAEEQSRIELRFPVLNKGDYFFVQVLVNGAVSTEDLSFTIAAEDLPPKIFPKQRPFSPEQREPTTGIPAMLKGFVPLALAVSTAFGIAVTFKAMPQLFPGHATFSWWTWSTLALLLWTGGIVYWLFRGAQLVIMNGILHRRRHFHLPRPVEARQFPTFAGGSYDVYAQEMRQITNVLADPTAALSNEERRALLRHLQMLQRHSNMISRMDRSDPGE